MGIILNDLETKRFGITCAKLDEGSPDLGLVNEQAEAQNVAMLSTRVSVEDFARIHELEQDGYCLMDTLVYYGRSLYGRSQQGSEKSRVIASGLNLRYANTDDEESVGLIAEQAFGNYFGHYHADSRLDNQAADAAYMEWAQVSVRNLHERAPVLIMEKGEEVVGFLTMRLNSDVEGEACLSGVAPAYQSKGVYNQLISQSVESFKELGARRMVVSTQVNNYAVQKVWSRHGMCLERAYYTFHKWMD